MPSNVIGTLIEIGLAQVLGVMALIGMLAAATGWFYYGVRQQKNKLRDDATKGRADAAREWRDVAEAHAAKIEDLNQQVQTWKLAHDQCEKKINKITQFNLRLQSREHNYQRTINRLEIKAGLEPTDFYDTSDPQSLDR